MPARRRSPLATEFVKKFATAFAKPLSGVSAGAERLLMSAAWPGNVRELRNCLERACMLADEAIISEAAIQSALLPATTEPMREVVATNDDLKSIEREHIARVLAQAGGSKAAAARRLGISRRALDRRLAFHNLALPPH